MLDRAFAAPAVWIEAQPGAGKTTLAANWLDQRKRPCLWCEVDVGDADPATFFHYLGLAAKHLAPRYKQPLPHLTPEYLPGIEVFTRRFFEELFRRMPQDGVLVLDNLQAAGVGGMLHDILRIAIESLPADVKMLCISRLAPPMALARLRANGQVAVLPPAAICLTLDEAQGIAALRGHVNEAGVASIHERTHGWVSGLVLMLEGSVARAEVGIPNAPGSRGKPGKPDTQILFNYFATEVMYGLDEPKRQILAKSALLPKFRATDIEALTGNAGAAKMIAEMEQCNYFIYRLSPTEPVYEYHPLFREFLLACLQDMVDEPEHARLRSHAGKLLDEAGELEEAAVLWGASRNWAALVPHIMKHAPGLLAEGRAHVVEQWLASLPAELTTAEPWLQYWMGACRLAFDPARARTCFERSFALFEKAGDLSGQCESWASIIDSFNLEWNDFKPLDHWIAVMDRLIAKNPEFPSPESEVRVASGMLSALTNRQPGRSDHQFWAEKVESIVLTSNNVALRMMLGNTLVFYYMWVGDFSRIAVLIDVLRPGDVSKDCDSLSRQYWHVMVAMYSSFIADWETCRKAIENGLMDDEESGVHILDTFLLGQAIYCALSLSEVEKAQAFLGRMALINSPRLGDKAFFHYQAAAVSWRVGKFGKSTEHARLAVKICEEMGWPNAFVPCLIELAVDLFDSGRHDEADASIGRAMDACRGMPGLEFIACMNGARFAIERGSEERTRTLLERGLHLGSRYGFLNLPRWNDDMMTRLLAWALESGIETEYVSSFIRKRGLVPPGDGNIPELWPWPLRIETLGRFALVKDGQATQSAGKAQKRTLELLKACIAFGGIEVSEQRLCDALWPGSEADDARAAFKITLHRLRSMVGHGALLLHESKLSLNLRRCRVDALEFERTAGNLIAAEHLSLPELNRYGAKVAQLYRGSFLPDEDSVFALTARERLRVKWMRAVGVLAEGLLRHGACCEALEWYERGLEAEPLAEPFYQGLMRALLSLRRTSEGLAAYERCATALELQLRVAPSPETEALAQALRAPGP